MSTELPAFKSTFKCPQLSLSDDIITFHWKMQEMGDLLSKDFGIAGSFLNRPELAAKYAAPDADKHFNASIVAAALQDTPKVIGQVMLSLGPILRAAVLNYEQRDRNVEFDYSITHLMHLGNILRRIGFKIDDPLTRSRLHGALHGLRVDAEGSIEKFLYNFRFLLDVIRQHGETGGILDQDAINALMNSVCNRPGLMHGLEQQLQAGITTIDEALSALTSDVIFNEQRLCEELEAGNGDMSASEPEVEQVELESVKDNGAKLPKCCEYCAAKGVGSKHNMYNADGSINCKKFAKTFYNQYGGF